MKVTLSDAKFNATEEQFIQFCEDYGFNANTVKDDDQTTVEIPLDDAAKYGIISYV